MQVSSRLSELETTLDAGIRHRNKALTSIGFELTKWMSMVRHSHSVGVYIYIYIFCAPTGTLLMQITNAWLHYVTSMILVVD